MSGSSINVTGSGLCTPLVDFLNYDVQPGQPPDYQMCKTIYSWHPLGGKIVDAPTKLAQSRPRNISVPGGPEERLRARYIEKWRVLRCDEVVANLMTVSRMYGIGSLGVLTSRNGKIDDVTQPLDFKSLESAVIAFNVFDPLNTAGSLVLSQQPNSMDFLKPQGISVAGVAYAKNRQFIKINEAPIYIDYTVSAFGFVGRSVYQRVIYPLKSFVQTMTTDDLITVKSGVIVAKMEQAGSFIDGAMQTLFGQKRQVVKDAQTANVISVGTKESIETLNMQNIDGAYGLARSNILKNIATGVPMPAQLIENETMVSGFGEGTEDAKSIAQWIDGYRQEMDPIYAFLDAIVQRVAWGPDFYETLKADFTEYADKPYDEAFYEWTRSFATEWPSLLKEPESELVKVDDVKLKGIIAAVQVFSPLLDPLNKARLIQWAADNLNENKIMFSEPLEFDMDALAEYVPPQPAAEEEPKPGHPFAAQDSGGGKRLAIVP